MKEALDVLKSGTDLWKVRYKGGIRGHRGYKRKYRLDLSDLVIKYIPHKGAIKNVSPTSCVKGEIKNMEYYYILETNTIFLV